MGKITGSNITSFKSAEYIYSKIKREFKSFGSTNLLDDADFPLYTAEVLKSLGNCAYKEDDAVLKVINGKASLPKDFMQLHAAYKCSGYVTEHHNSHFQNKHVYENDITCEILGRTTNCEIHCECPDKIIERVTVKQYVNEGYVNHDYTSVCLLKLSPNMRSHCADNCVNPHIGGNDEITINNGQVLTNFDKADIYIQYYGFAKDESGLPMIPNIIEVEKAVENYIKWQILINYWVVGDVPDIMQKAQYYQNEYLKSFAAAKYIGKLPAFSTLVNQIRTQRGINKVNFFSQV